MSNHGRSRGPAAGRRASSSDPATAASVPHARGTWRPPADGGSRTLGWWMKSTSPGPGVLGPNSLGHRSDKSMAAVYYRLRAEDSQSLMGRIPFGTGGPAADAGKEAGR